MITLEALQRRNPEWRPWLAVVEAIQAEIANPAWEAVAGRAVFQAPQAGPLLAGATFEVDRALLRAMLGRLPALERSGRELELLEAALNGEPERLNRLAGVAGADPDAFGTMAALLPMPLLHACRRRLAERVPLASRKGHCPVCGSWPAFAEVCGVERARYLRCIACGAGWAVPGLACAYCGTTEHEQLGSLVPEQGAAGSSIDVCRSCLGYLKCFTRLNASPAEALMLHDLASVELDLAAAERGYSRPPGCGHALHARLAPSGAAVSQ